MGAFVPVRSVTPRRDHARPADDPFADGGYRRGAAAVVSTAVGSPQDHGTSRAPPGAPWLLRGDRRRCSPRWLARRPRGLARAGRPWRPSQLGRRAPRARTSSPIPSASRSWPRSQVAGHARRSLRRRARRSAARPAARGHGSRRRTRRARSEDLPVPSKTSSVSSRRTISASPRRCSATHCSQDSSPAAAWASAWASAAGESSSDALTDSRCTETTVHGLPHWPRSVWRGARLWSSCGRRWVRTGGVRTLSLR